MNSALEEVKKKMEKSLKNFKEELSHIRTGRASIALLEAIKVDCYGTKMPIPQIATVNVVEGKMLVIQPWDINLVKEIEKAIQKSDLGINPTSDGKTIKLIMPPLTEERRKELIKVASKLAEEARIAIRNIRRDVLEKFKTAKKKGEISEDDYLQLEKKVQKLTDEYIEKINTALKEKEKEILAP
ncbi:Ribosome-recycling factor [Thermodesulfobacterium geofontis OPF15]|uniref:Ribosome-recycling factor n=2 Tax=Thermodesulfobacterium geofontis TaxID=1295609 RepID=F8C5X1_THEGP|nr:ribosome recycling factor [Thermodesulfobacterium geofontis]AEH23112.1 Ribosome-recycling factor [Thermodesulfobacterium geofontis OPF15]